MSPVKKPEVLPVPSTTDQIKVRTQGLQLVGPLQKEIDRLTVTDQEGYLNADEVLGRIRNARTRWATMVEPIATPIQELKSSLKKLEAGFKGLNAEVDGELERMERAVKEEMRQFKVEERRLLQEAEAEKEREADKLRREAAIKEEAARVARTPQMKAKLQQRSAELKAQAQAVEQDTSDTTPIKGGSSTTRTISKPQITDLRAFLGALTEQTMKAGLYDQGHPPLALFDEGVVAMLRSRIQQLYSSQPGVVASWPGVSIIEEIIIAGR